MGGVDPARAFVLFACCEQARLIGNEVTLVRLDDHAATLRIVSNELLVYAHAAHLAPRISREDYRAILEGIWVDRAERSGWRASVTMNDDGTLLIDIQR